MGIVFKSDQPQTELPLVTRTVLSVVEENAEQDLVQHVFTPEEEAKLAIQFIEENALYDKFLLWCGIQDQLLKLRTELAPKLNLEPQSEDSTL